MSLPRSGGLPRFEEERATRGLRVPRGRCRECGEPVSGRRRSWCSDACVQGFRLRSDPGYQRHAVELRDQGRCAVCGRDCRELARRLRVLRLVPYSLLLGVLRSSELPTWWSPDDRFPGRGREERRRLVLEAVELYRDLGVWPGPNGHAPHLDRSTWWDMDHAQPLAEGGSHDLENLRTLCIPCHAAASAEGAGRRARARRVELAQELEAAAGEELPEGPVPRS